MTTKCNMVYWTGSWSRKRTLGENESVQEGQKQASILVSKTFWPLEGAQGPSLSSLLPCPSDDQDAEGPGNSELLAGGPCLAQRMKVPAQLALSIVHACDQGSMDQGCSTRAGDHLARSCLLQRPLARQACGEEGARQGFLLSLPGSVFFFHTRDPCLPFPP